MNSPKHVEKLRGKVTSAPYGSGSKSERVAVFVDTAQGRYLLRRKAGPAFADDELTRYIGTFVECDGFLVETTLIAEHIRQVK